MIGYSKGGWLMVLYAGPEMMAIDIEVGGTWTPAYLDYDNGQRIAMIPTLIPEGRQIDVRVRNRAPEIDNG